MKGKLIDFCLNITDGEHCTVSDDLNGGYLLLANQNIVDGEIIKTSFDRKISKETYERINKRCKIEKGDVLISTVGTLGKVAVIEDEDPNYVFQRSVGIIKPNKDLLCSEYLKYVLMSPTMQRVLLNNSKGAVQKCIFIDDLKELPIDAPSVPEQQKIVSILDKIDKKISNNNKTNSLLQQLVRDIYNRYFIQFDFDYNGGFYKSSKNPMKDDDNYPIQIPSMWKVGKLEEMVKGITTGLNPRDNFVLTTTGYKYITVKNLTTSGELDFQDCDYVDEKSRNMIHERSGVSKGDILFASIAPLGRCYLVDEDPDDWEINESVFCVKPTHDYLQLYLYLLFTSDYFVEKVENSSTGSVFNGIRISTMMDMYFLIPDKTTLLIFNQKIEKAFEKIMKIFKENKKLRQLKDELLPLLMNGQVISK